MGCKYQISVPLLTTSVNRTSLVLYVSDRIERSMPLPPSRRPAAALIMVFLLLLAQSPPGFSGQSADTTAAQKPTTLGPAQTPIRPDPRRAATAVERGQKAEREGRMEDALAAYDEAARYAPQDIEIVSHGAALRSSLVRSQVDNAERLALAGHIPEALDSLH